MKIKPLVNTLRYQSNRCVNCGMCIAVCPQGVFEPGEKTVKMVNRKACIECGACMLNCEPGAIQVQAGVGCAATMIQAALTSSKEPICGPECRC